MGLREEECLLLLRIPVETMLEKTRELYDDPEEGHGVGVLAASLLRDAYLKDPTEMCGKSPKTLMAGAIYVAGILKGLPKSQWEIADVCGCTQTTLRTRYRHLVEILGYPSDGVMRNVLRERRG